MKINLDKYEIGIIINALNELRNSQIKQLESTAAIDELYLKIIRIYKKINNKHKIWKMTK